VLKVYPVLYFEKGKDRNITRSQRAEEEEIERIQNLKSTKSSDLYMKFQKESEEEIKKLSKKKYSTPLKRCLDGKQLYERSYSYQDKEEFQNLLSKSQIRELEKYKENYSVEGDITSKVNEYLTVKKLIKVEPNWIE
jgi:hypothetical protein